MKASRCTGTGFVEITLREPVYKHLLNVLGRFTKAGETTDDCEWLDRFIADLKIRDAADVGINSTAIMATPQRPPTRFILGKRQLTVKIAFDEKSKVWVTWDSQVPGLTAFDSSKDGLLDQIEKVTPLLLNLNAKYAKSRLPPDKEYEVVVIEQTPPVFVEQLAPQSDIFEVRPCDVRRV